MFSMSTNYAIGRGGSDPHGVEDDHEVSSHREGGGSVRQGDIREGESQVPRGQGEMLE